MTIKLTREHFRRLSRNAAELAANPDVDLRPVAKLFMPCGPARWLLVALDPARPGIAYGIADLGLDCVEDGPIDLAALATLTCPLGLGVEVDKHWSPKARTSAYLAEGMASGRLDCSLADEQPVERPT